MSVNRECGLSSARRLTLDELQHSASKLQLCFSLVANARAESFESDLQRGGRATRRSTDWMSKDGSEFLSLRCAFG
ncbi:uncharacterized [Tachysurus ichikawai]